MFALEPHAVVVRAVAVVSTIDDAKLGEGMSTQIDVLITRLSETAFRELFDCSPKKTLVDLASGEIPRIPTATSTIKCQSLHHTAASARLH